MKKTIWAFEKQPTVAYEIDWLAGYEVLKKLKKVRTQPAPLRVILKIPDSIFAHFAFLHMAF